MLFSLAAHILSQWTEGLWSKSVWEYSEMKQWDLKDVSVEKPAVLLSMFLSPAIKATKPSEMRTAGGDTKERQSVWSKGWPRVYLLTLLSSKQNPTPKHRRCEMSPPQLKDLCYLRQTASVKLALKQQSGVYCVMTLMQHNTPLSLSNTTAVQQTESLKNWG